MGQDQRLAQSSKEQKVWPRLRHKEFVNNFYYTWHFCTLIFFCFSMFFACPLRVSGVQRWPEEKRVSSLAASMFSPIDPVVHFGGSCRQSFAARPLRLHPSACLLVVDTC